MKRFLSGLVFFLCIIFFSNNTQAISSYINDMQEMMYIIDDDNVTYIEGVVFAVNLALYNDREYKDYKDIKDIKYLLRCIESSEWDSKSQRIWDDMTTVALKKGILVRDDIIKENKLYITKNDMIKFIMKAIDMEVGIEYMKGISPLYQSDEEIDIDYYSYIAIKIGLANYESDDYLQREEARAILYKAYSMIGRSSYATYNLDNINTPIDTTGYDYSGKLIQYEDEFIVMQNAKDSKLRILNLNTDYTIRVNDRISELKQISIDDVINVKTDKDNKIDNIDVYRQYFYPGKVIDLGLNKLTIIYNGEATSFKLNNDIDITFRDNSVADFVDIKREDNVIVKMNNDGEVKAIRIDDVKYLRQIKGTIHSIVEKDERRYVYISDNKTINKYKITDNTDIYLNKKYNIADELDEGYALKCLVNKADELLVADVYREERIIEGYVEYIDMEDEYIDIKIDDDVKRYRLHNNIDIINETVYNNESNTQENIVDEDIGGIIINKGDKVRVKVIPGDIVRELTIIKRHEQQLLEDDEMLFKQLNTKTFI